jgi:hypothetical protein
MRRTILRSLGVALVVLIAQQALALAGFLEFCPHHQAWRRIVEKRSTVVLDSGMNVARSDDAIYVCGTRHCFGLVICHDELLCICAPAILGPSRVASLVGGSCVVDQPHPSRDDLVGACQHARCDDHVGP